MRGGVHPDVLALQRRVPPNCHPNLLRNLRRNLRRNRLRSLPRRRTGQPVLHHTASGHNDERRSQQQQSRSRPLLRHRRMKLRRRQQVWPHPVSSAICCLASRLRSRLRRAAMRTKLLPVRDASTAPAADFRIRHTALHSNRRAAANAELRSGCQFGLAIRAAHEKLFLQSTASAQTTAIAGANVTQKSSWQRDVRLRQRVESPPH